MTQNEIEEIMRLLEESDTTKWPVEDQIACNVAYLTMIKTIAPIVLRNSSKEESATFLFKIRKDWLI